MIPWSLASAVRGSALLVDEPIRTLVILITLIGVVAGVMWLLGLRQYG
jgi:hypothetical protein